MLNARSARSATCSFNPTPDPTVDGSPTSLRNAIQAANASGQDCLITLAKGTYTLTIKNTNGHENDAAQGDLDIGDSGHTVTIQGQGAASSIVNGNKIDRVFDVLDGADAVFSNLTIEGGIAQDDGTPGALPGTTAALGGGILAPRHRPGQSRRGDDPRESGAWGERSERRERAVSRPAVELVNRQPAAASILPDPSICRTPRSLEMLRAEVSEAMVARTTMGGLGGGGGAGGTGAGGGLYVLSGSVNLSASTVSGNSATGGAGGNGGRVVTGEVVVSGARGAPAGDGDGGGAFVGGGTLTLSASTVSLNSVMGGNGGNGAVHAWSTAGLVETRKARACSLPGGALASQTARFSPIRRTTVVSGGGGISPFYRR